MEQKIIFREMLSEALKLADAKGNRLTTEEIDAFLPIPIWTGSRWSWCMSTWQDRR